MQDAKAAEKEAKKAKAAEKAAQRGAQKNAGPTEKQLKAKAEAEAKKVMPEHIQGCMARKPLILARDMHILVAKARRDTLCMILHG